MNLGIINDHEIILSPNLENGTHLPLRTYRSRDLGDRNYQGHHWSRVLVSGLSSHRMGNRNTLHHYFIAASIVVFSKL